MSPTERFRINASRVAHETIDGETLIINLDNGNYYSLLRIGAAAWAIVERGAAVGDVVEAIEHRYKGDRADMEKAINKFMAELQAEGLIAVDNGHAPEPTAAAGPWGEPYGSEERPAFEVPVLNKYTDMQDLLLLDPIHEVDETGWPTPRLSADE